jgi:hypothetical protein
MGQLLQCWAVQVSQKLTEPAIMCCQCTADSLMACHVQDFDIPQEMKAVHVYLDNIRSRSSWQNTSYSDDVLLSGWKPKLGSG